MIIENTAKVEGFSSVKISKGSAGGVYIEAETPEGAFLAVEWTNEGAGDVVSDNGEEIHGECWDEMTDRLFEKIRGMENIGLN